MFSKLHGRIPSTKGSVLDLFYIAIMGLVIAIAGVLALTLSDEVTPRLQDRLGTAGDSGYDMITDQNSAHAAVFDSTITFLLVGAAIVTIILATQIPTHPVMFIASVIMTLMLLLVSPIMSNAFVSMSSDSNLVSAGNQLPMAVALLTNWPLILLGFGSILTIAIYMKMK